MVTRNLAVFDFDWSFIEVDSDYFVIQDLSQKQWEKCKSLAHMQWTDLMDQTLCELQDEGVSIPQLTSVLQKIKLSPVTLKLLNTLKANGTHVLILSDANTFFINTILEANGVKDKVDSVITNPAYIDDQGRLRIRRHILATDQQHNCPNACSLNICKGQELDRFIATHGPFNKVMYVGDGQNDYCPGIRLRDSDHYFVRSGKKLAELLKSDNQIVAKITYWEDHTPILETVLTEQL